MTKDEALKLKPGTKIRITNTGEILIFEGFVTFEIPPYGEPTLFCKLLNPNGMYGYQQPQDMGPFEVVKDE
jgi:hypothetical protein